MNNLPFQTISRVEQLMEQMPLENLVLIFCAKDNTRFLFVYHTTQLPNPTPAVNDKVKIDLLRLDKLQKASYSGYDGLVIGFSAIDVVFDDIPTHGIYFYSMVHLFAKKEKLAIFCQTAFKLAQWLYIKLKEHPNLYNDFKSRSWKKIILLPFLKKVFQYSSVLHETVAFVPHEDILIYLSENPDSMTRISSQDISSGHLSVKNKGQWLIAFNEIELLLNKSKSDKYCLINLRFLLRSLNYLEQLKQARLSLAKYCLERWQLEGEEHLLITAYALGTEAWLEGEDVDDLIAFFPHRDFNHFITTGDGIRVYRTPRINNLVGSAAARPTYYLNDILQDKAATDFQIAEYNTYPFSFSVLSSIWRRYSTKPVIDLGPILWKAGKGATLASTFLLLSRDLLRPPTPDWLAINAQVADITSLALRSIFIYSMKDPWHENEKPGRYSQFLDQSYKHLFECLSNEIMRASNTPLQEYFTVLKEWYGCYSSPDIPGSISKMLRAGRTFIERNKNQLDFPEQFKAVTSLHKLGKLLIAQDYSTSYDDDNHPLALPKTLKIESSLQHAADESVKLEMLSLNLSEYFAAYEFLHTTWEYYQKSLKERHVIVEMITRLLRDYEALEHMIYALPHELKVIRWACQEDIKRIRHYQKSVDIGPYFRIKLLNPQVILERKEEIHLEVENLGGADAQHFRIELTSSRKFELSQPAIYHTQDILAPLHPRRYSWTITPKDLKIELVFAFKYQDINGKLHEREESRPIKVVDPRESKRTPLKTILYQAGIPVYGREQFFGRKTELTQIFRRLLGDTSQPILIRGPRRMGKSSLLRQLDWLLHEPEEIRKMGFSTEQELQLSAIRTVVFSLQELTPSADYFARFFKKIYMNCCKALGAEVEPTNIAMDFGFDPVGDFKYYISRLFKERPQSRLLIIMDEWDTLRSAEYSGLAANIRSIMEWDKRLHWIVSSTWALNQEISRFGSPLFNLVFTIELGAMNWEEITKLVIEPAEKMGVMWQGDAVVLLLELTARRPYLVQLLCSRAMDFIHDNSTNLVDREVIDLVTNKIIKETLSKGSLFGYLWGDIIKTEDDAYLHSMGQLILWILDRYENEKPERKTILKKIQQEFTQKNLEPFEEAFFMEEFDEQMDRLLYIFDVLERDEKNYRFSIPLARQCFHYEVSRAEEPVLTLYAGIKRDCESWKKSRGVNSK